MNHIDNLKTLCGINSKSKLDGEFNRSGINRAHQAYIEMFLGLPIELDRLESKEGADLVLIKSKKRHPNKPKILLSGHIDTVLTPEEVEFKIENGKVFGSGVSDMKGGLIVMNEVFLRLYEMGQLENIDIVVSPEEEVALPNHMENIRKIAKVYDFIFVYESTLDTMEYIPLTDRGLVISRRGYQQFYLKISSDGGHSGAIVQQEKRVSSNLIMAEFMIELEKLADYGRKLTYNSGLLKGGKAVNIISPICELTFDSRFTNAESHSKACDDVVKLVANLRNKYPKADFELVLQDFFPAMDEREKTTSFIEEFKKHCSSQIHLERRNGGSEASIFADANKDAIVIDGLGVRGGGEHTNNEFAYLQSFHNAVKFTLDLITFSHYT